jgi:hypothetical protein
LRRVGHRVWKSRVGPGHAAERLREHADPGLAGEAGDVIVNFGRSAVTRNTARFRLLPRHRPGR